MPTKVPTITGAESVMLHNMHICRTRDVDSESRGCMAYVFDSLDCNFVFLHFAAISIFDILGAKKQKTVEIKGHNKATPLLRLR